MDKRDAIIAPCDLLQIPVFGTYRAARGVVVSKAMFWQHDYIVVRYVEDTGYNKDILLCRPPLFEDCKNYWDTDAKKWVIV